MTAATFYLPYQRQSAARIPRRDLMLGAADSLSLRVIVVETDHPSSQALLITGGIGGPSMRFVIWSDIPHGPWCDYGAPWSWAGGGIWSGVGVPGDAAGSFDFDLSAGWVSAWPRRAGFSIQLDWDGGFKSELLCQGVLQVLQGWGNTAPVTPILTTTAAPILLA
jgi:hypothetical protein